MGRKAAPPRRLEGWYRLQESAGKGKTLRQFDMTIDLMYSGRSFYDIQADMERIRADYGAEFTDFKFESEMESYPYEEGEHVVTYVYGYRKETDAEYETRLAEAAKIDADREARERAEFERLAAKFADRS